MTGTPAPRHPTRDDLAAVGALFRARDVARSGVPEVSDDELAHDWSVPGFDLACDAWLIEDGGTPVAYADVFADEPGSRDGGGSGPTTFLLETVTAAGHGHLEPMLLDLVERRALEIAGRGAVTLHAMVVDTETERATRYREAGYRRVRTFLRMRLEPGDPAPEPRWPAGVAPEPFDPAVHAGEVHAVLQAAFSDHFAAGRPGPLEQWRHDALEHPGLDPGLWVLAREGGRLVGAAVAVPEEGKGWVKSLGVLREARGRGVAAAVLAEAIRRLRGAGLATVELGVDAASLTGATRLYERAGMRAVRRSDIYEKLLDGAPGV